MNIIIMLTGTLTHKVDAVLPEQVFVVLHHDQPFGLGPGFFPRPFILMSLLVPVLGLFLLGFLPLPSVMS